MKTEEFESMSVEELIELLPEQSRIYKCAFYSEHNNSYPKYTVTIQVNLRAKRIADRYKDFEGKTLKETLLQALYFIESQG